MRRYRVWLNRRTRPFSQYVWADQLEVNTNGVLYLFKRGNNNGRYVVAAYSGGSWTRVKVTNS